MSDEEWMPPKPTGKSGVEVRVIGDGMVDPKRREAQESAWEENERAGDEEVIRLDQGPVSLGNRKFEDEEPMVLEEGTKKLFSGLRGLTVLMGLVAVLMAVVGVSLVINYRGQQVGQDTGVELFGVVEELEPVESEHVESGYSAAELKELGDQAADLAIEYAEAKTSEEVLPLILKSEGLSDLLEQRWEPLDLAEIGKRNLSCRIIEEKGRVVLAIAGRERNGKYFGLIYCLEGEEMKLDWEASIGVGDVGFEDLNKVPLGERVRMRVFLESSNFHPVEYPDDEYRSYLIQHPEGRFPVYGYAKHGSNAVVKLAEILNEGAMLVARQRRAGAIVVLENSGRGASRQFVIAEVIQGGWIEQE